MTRYALDITLDGADLARLLPALPADLHHHLRAREGGMDPVELDLHVSGTEAEGVDLVEVLWLDGLSRRSHDITGWLPPELRPALDHRLLERGDRVWGPSRGR